MSRRSLLVPALLTLAVAACAPVRSQQDVRIGAPGTEGGAPAPTSAPVAARPAGAPAPSAADGASARSAAAPAAASPAQGLTVPTLDRMIIRTVTINMTVEKVADAYRQVELIATEAGGTVATSSIKQDGSATVATMTIRVPADSRTYSTTLERLRGLSTKVVDESVSSQDVTEEFVDLESSLRNLRATEARLLTLLDRAQKVEEVITVQRELTNVRGQIERIEGRRTFLERKSEFTTITVTMRELPTGRSSSGGWSPLDTFNEATAALLKALEGAAKAGIWLIVMFPVYALPLLAAGWLIGRVTHRRATA